jgi:type IV secretion system protein VirB1
MTNRLFKHRYALLVAAGAAWAACGVPGAARAAPLSSVNFKALATRCASSVPQGILGAVARTESNLEPWALHDNTTGATEQPASQQAALSDAWAWIGRGDSVDVGLMQINSANFSALGLTAHSALDPCASLAGGAAVLQAAYGGGKSSAEQEAALLMALSRYNTGSPFKGILNGYAHHVIANADGEGQADAGTAAPPARPVQGVALADPNAPPSWNIWATAAYVQAHGAPWLIPQSQAAQPPARAQKPLAGRPVPVSPAANEVAAIQVTSSTQQPQRTP